MGKIRCPACWNEIEQGEENCPICGFLLRVSDKNITSGNWGYKEKSNQQRTKNINSSINVSAVNEKEIKDRKIIISATIAICVILVMAFAKGMVGNNTNTKSSNSENKSGYTSNYTVTTGNEGALNKAKSYLKSSAFSYSGLIGQLEYEGYSESEATYGANNCGADWKEQALRKAKSYLSSSAFSELGLQEQLENEGFTTEQAMYGIENCGANWKDQAVKKAASYLKSHPFTKSELIDQLEYEGFSYEQATYGASKNGL